MISTRLLFLVGLFSLASSSVRASDPEGLRPGSRVVFLGDSITHAGHYIAVLEAHMRSAGIDGVELINLGLASETCTGLTEPDHPFPRPNVHERLDRVLEKAHPSVVFVCYGMNDGIYHPYSAERFEAYQQGIRSIIDKVHKAGALVILLTPPPFDPHPLALEGKLAPDGAEKYGWTTVYHGYAQVLTTYAHWVLTLKDQADLVIDVHQPILDYLAARRVKEPDFLMAADGVHMNEEGHQVMAEAILAAMNVPVSEEVDPALISLLDEKQAMAHLAWLTLTGHTRPGVPDGLPMAQAQAQIKVIDEKVAALVKPQAPLLWMSLEKTLRETDDLIEHALRRAQGESPAVSLFNGKSLDGWTGDERFWSVKDGRIIGRNDGVVPSSTYLFTKKDYREFRLRFQVKQTLSPKHSTMHSAVAALGERIRDAGDNPFGFKGPLLMFCHDWGIWDAHRRNRVEPANHQGTLLHPAERKGEWNEVEILVIGDRIRFVVNGALVFDFTDLPGMLKASPIGLQLHANQKPQEYQFRNLSISENPVDLLLTLRPNRS